MKKLFNIIISSALLLTPQALVAATGSDAPVLNVLRDTVVSSDAFNFKQGTYGTSVNGQTYQNEAVVTFNGWQYTAFWHNNAVDYTKPRPALARRKLPDGDWQPIVFEDYNVNNTFWEYGGNTHNVASIGIASDGYIHTAYDHHNNPLKYRKSTTPLALEPESADWSTGSFGVTVDSLGSAGQPGNLSYPLFFNDPDGGLHFSFRNDSSGNGDWMLYKYENGGSGTFDWKLQGMLFSRTGSYAGRPSRCAYPNQFRYDSNKRLHATWMWREQSMDTRGNHDLCYAYSDDGGTTWKNDQNVTIAVLDGTKTYSTAGTYPNAISINSADITVYPIAFDKGMMNQGTMFLDSENRPHTVIWRNPTGAAASNDYNNWRYYHYWRDTNGTWNEQLLPFWGRKPQAVLDDNDNMYVIFGQWNQLGYTGLDLGSVLSIARATEASGWSDWELTHVYGDTKVFHGEPQYDLARWKQDEVLAVYYQERPVRPGEPSDLHVIELGNTGGEAQSPVTVEGFEFSRVPEQYPPKEPDGTDAQRAPDLDYLDYDNLGVEYGTVSRFSAQENTTNSAVRVIDGNVDINNNRWAAESVGGISGKHQWVEIDLGENRSISATQLFAYENRAYKYKIEVKMDGEEDSAYKMVVNETENTTATPLAHTFTPVTARYVKLTVTGIHNSSSVWVSIVELRILGKPPTPGAEFKYTINNVTLNSGTISAEVATNDGTTSSFKAIASAYDDQGQMIYAKQNNSATEGTITFTDAPQDTHEVLITIWEWPTLSPLASSKRQIISTK